MKSTYTILILLQATPTWLGLSRQERAGFYDSIIQPLFLKFAASCSFRLFDSEFFHASVSDFLLVETTNLEDYQKFIEMLRDTPFYGVPYFEIKDIIPARENAFLEYDQEVGVRSEGESPTS